MLTFWVFSGVLRVHLAKDIELNKLGEGLSIWRKACLQLKHFRERLHWYWKEFYNKKYNKDNTNVFINQHVRKDEKGIRGETEQIKLLVVQRCQKDHEKLKM